MKRGVYILILVAVLLSVSACSATATKPSEGIWYCEELKIGIDFSMLEKTIMCAKLYNEDGTYEILGCHFDYGCGVTIFQEINGCEIDLLNGCFIWEENEFIVTSYVDNSRFVFKLDDTVS